MLNRYKVYYNLVCISFWCVTCNGIIAEDILHMDAFKELSRLFFDVVILLLGIIVLRDGRDKFFFWSLVGISIISSIFLNHLGIITTLNGFRGFIGLACCAPVIRWLYHNSPNNDFFTSINRQLYVLLWLQAPAITWQYIKYGVAYDGGGGTFGYGYSGTVSTIIYFLSFYFMIQRWDKDLSYWQNLKANWVLIFLLYPSMLNETKISFIYLLLYFILLLPLKKRDTLKLIAASPILLIFMAVVGYIYLNITHQDFEQTFGEEALDTYLSGGDEIDRYIDLAQMLQDGDFDNTELWVEDIPRFAKIMRMGDILKDTGGKWVLGGGLGHFKGGSTLDKTPLRKKWNWLISATVPLTLYLVVQLGLLGLLWFMADMLTLTPFKKVRQYHWKHLLAFFTAIWAVTLLYNDFFIVSCVCFILFLPVMATTLFYDPDEKKDMQTHETLR